MNKAQADALKKVHKLLRLAQSDNEAEAMLAAQRAEEIMIKYEIKAAMLDVPPEQEEPIMDFGEKEAHLHKSKRLERWAFPIATPIAKAHACKIYRLGHNLEIIGRPSDVDTVRYMFMWAVVEAMKFANIKGIGCGPVWKTNYMVGFGEGLAEAFHKAREAAESEMRGETTSANALVVVNRAIAKVSQKLADTIKWQKQHVPLHSGRSSSGQWDGAAHAEGKRDGAKFQVGRRTRKIGTSKGSIEGN